MANIGAIWGWITDHATVLSAVVSGISTGCIAWFTISLVKSSNQQGKITGDALKLARDEFNASHRPLLVIREIELFWVMDETTLSFVLINEGDADALNIALAVTLRVRMIGLDIGAGTPIVFEDGQIPSELAIGRSVRCKGCCSVKIPALFESYNLACEGKSPMTNDLSFEGVSSYSGETGILRRSAYYRPFDYGTIRFLPSDNSEREYPG